MEANLDPNIIPYPSPEAVLSTPSEATKSGYSKLEAELFRNVIFASLVAIVILHAATYP
jgi:hypothetical protein